MGERIRLRYSGLVLFIANIVNLFVGVVFLFFLARNLTQAEFGAWSWISEVVSYTMIPLGFVSFWEGRFVARDPENSKTALVLNTLLMIPFFVIYLLTVPLLSGAVQTSYFVFLMAALLVPLNYLVATMSYVGGNIKPEYTGYAGLIFQPVKLFLAFMFLIVLGLSLVGAVLTLEIALVVQILVLVILTRRYLHYKFRKKVASQWVSRSWLSGYVSNSTVLTMFDAALVVAVVGVHLSATAAADVLAYYLIALAISQLVGIAGSMAGNLTTKLLKGGEASDIEVMLRLTFLFGIPILAGGLLLTRPLVYVVAPQYSIIVPIVRILMFSALFDIISSIADSVVQGTVNIDRGKAGFKELAKSRLFLMPSINFLTGASYLVALFLTLTAILSNSSPSIFELALVWSIVFFLVKIPFILYKFWLSKRVARFRIPFVAIAKYCAGSVVMALVLIYVMYFTPFLVYVPSGSVRAFILYPLILVGVGSIVYFVLMFGIDSEFRQLVGIAIRSVHLRRSEK